MAPIDPATSNNTIFNDELDNILEEDLDLSNIRPQQTTQAQPTAQTATDVGLEEVKIVKKRQPIPKLDDNLILSTAGIPKLRKISKERLKFKGKGHEYGDIARMLNMYQLWLDDLYPRAKFADGLAMIEKLGHSKKINYLRKEWIDEGKPKTTIEEDDDDIAGQLEGAEKATEEDIDRMEDVADAGIAQDNTDRPVESSRQGGPPRQMADEEPDEDDLDALLAEAEAPSAPLTSALHPPRIANTEEDMFADEMEAMEGLDWGA